MDVIADDGAVAQNATATRQLTEWVSAVLQNGSPPSEQARMITERLGAHRCGSQCEVLFWAPDLLERRVPDGDIFIEVLNAEGDIELQRARQTVHFHRTLIPVSREDAYCMAVIDGMVAGTRDRVGSFYSLVWRVPEHRWSRFLDPLAA